MTARTSHSDVPADNTDRAQPNVRAENAYSLGWLLDSSEKFLSGKGVPEPRIAAELLAERILKIRRLELRAYSKKIVPQKFVDALRRGVMRTAAGEPVQYVLGRWDFREITLKVDKRALIPRPETEELVGLLLKSRPVGKKKNPAILDYGTGSGCIALSVAKELPAARVAAADISPDALSLAAENAVLLGLSEKITFIDTSKTDLADIFEPGIFDAVVSNPPYIPTASYETMERRIRDFEPRAALDGGPDGLEVARQIADESAMLLADGGGLFMELSAEDNHPRIMSQYLSGLGFDNIKTVRDAFGAERFLCAELAAGI